MIYRGLGHGAGVTANASPPPQSAEAQVRPAAVSKLSSRPSISTHRLHKRRTTVLVPRALAGPSISSAAASTSTRRRRTLSVAPQTSRTQLGERHASDHRVAGLTSLSTRSLEPTKYHSALDFAISLAKCVFFIVCQAVGFEPLYNSSMSESRLSTSTSAAFCCCHSPR